MTPHFFPWKLEKKNLVILALLLILFLIARSYFYYKNEKRTLLADRTDDLITIACLKTDQLLQWRNERSADADNISQSPFFIQFVEQYLAHPNDTAIREMVYDRLQLLKHSYKYDDVFLVDEQGRALLRGPGEMKSLDPAYMNDLRKAVDTHAVINSNFILTGNGLARIATISPLLAGNGKPLAYLVMQNDPETFIYPLIRSWPVQSKTAETYLVEQEGDSILILNDLRFYHDAPMRIKFPLTATEIPAVQAVLGKAGIVTGTDYKGEKVMAFISKIEGTPWYMVSKIAKTEIYHGLVGEGLLILGITLGMVLIIILGTLAILSSHWKNIYKSLYQTEKDLRSVQEEFRTILYSIGDGVIVTDNQARIQFMNTVAEKLTVWSEKEAHGKPLHEVFHLVNEERGNRLRIL